MILAETFCITDRSVTADGNDPTSHCPLNAHTSAFGMWQLAELVRLCLLCVHASVYNVTSYSVYLGKRGKGQEEFEG